jgi:hypothetical protein
MDPPAVGVFPPLATGTLGYTIAASYHGARISRSTDAASHPPIPDCATLLSTDAECDTNGNTSKPNFGFEANVGVIGLSFFIH